MTVDLVLPKLAEIEREVINPFIPIPVTYTYAYDAAPFSIGQTPAWVNLPGAASYKKIGESEKWVEIEETRIYTCNLYVIPKGEGADGEAFSQCEPFFGLGRAMFNAHSSLKLTQGIIRLTLLGDDGAKGEMVYAGQLYYGISFRVQVTTWHRDIYAARE